MFWDNHCGSLKLFTETFRGNIRYFVQFTRATNVNMTGGSTSKKYMGYLRKGLGNKYVSLNLLAATFRGNLQNFYVSS